MTGKRDISLYFHIPFCTKKCPYCHFFVLPDKDPFKKQLMQGLSLEWGLWKQAFVDKNFISIYFGGGTPALLGPHAMAEILKWIPHSSVSSEITLEANPENMSADLLKAYREIGINRISIGIQSFDPQLLQTLGRVHSAKKAFDSITLAYQAGFQNISIDLMYDLPGQTLVTWKKTLDQVRSLPITHLSLYNLTIEPQTVFFKYREKLSRLLPDETCSLEMYQMAVEKLEEMGLQQYEISAFAKPTFLSRHNTGYWKGRPFIGFGPSAFSYWEGKRFRNVAHLNRYCSALSGGNSPVDFEEELPPESRRRELLAIQLRMLEGVDLKAFQQQQGLLEERTLSVLKQLNDEKFLQFQSENVSLTKKGILFYDTVASEIV